MDNLEIQEQALPVNNESKQIPENVLGDSPQVEATQIQTKVAEISLDSEKLKPEPTSAQTAFVGWTPYLRPKSMASSSSSSSSNAPAATEDTAPVDDEKLSLQTKIGPRSSTTAQSPPHIREPLSATHLSPPTHRQYLNNAPASANATGSRFYPNNIGSFHRPLSYPAPLSTPQTPTVYQGTGDAGSTGLRSALSGGPRYAGTRPSSDVFLSGQSWKSAEAEAIDRFVEDLTYYERTLSYMAQAKTDDSFREELAAVEQWFSVLSEAERTTCIFSLVQHSSPMQVKFFMTVFAQMAQYDPVSNLAKPHVPSPSSAQTASTQPGPWTQRRSEVTQSWAPSNSNEDKQLEKTADDSLLMQQLRLSSSLARNRRANDRNGRPSAEERSGNYAHNSSEKTAGEPMSEVDVAQFGANSRYALINDKRASYHPESSQDIVAASDRMRNRLSLDVHSALASQKGPTSASVINAANWSYFASTPVSAGPASAMGKLEGETHATGTSLRPGLTIDTYGSRHSTIPVSNNRRATSTVNASDAVNGGLNRNGAALQSLSDPSKLEHFRPRSAGPSLGPQHKFGKPHGFTQSGAPLMGNQPAIRSAISGTRVVQNPFHPGYDYDLHGVSVPTTPFGYGDNVPDTYPSPTTGMFSPATMNAVQVAAFGVQHRPGGALGAARNAANRRSHPPATASPTNIVKEKPSGQVDLEVVKDIPAWLRSLRLHKYTECFQDLSWEEMINLDEDALEKRGVAAQGARKKLLKVFDMVKAELSGPSAVNDHVPESES